jgi:hypothetical protein
MDPTQAAHLARVRHLRESFAEANERLVARLRRAPDAAAEQASEAGWSAAQIGWHVAAVTTRFAGFISGDVAGPTRLPEGFQERPWAEIVALIPPRLKAPSSVQPPPVVRRGEAIAALEASGQRMAHALDVLTPDRGGRMGLTHPVVGVISVYQIGEWAIGHVIRHNKQAKLRLGE